MILILAVIGCIVAFLALGFSLSHRAAKKAGKLIKEIEDKYVLFIISRFSYQVVQADNLEVDQQKIGEEAMAILKPQIDGLISHINATDMGSVRTSVDSKIFPNLISLTNQFFETSKASEDGKLGKQEEAEVYQAVREAIQADITHKSLKLEMGEF